MATKVKGGPSADALCTESNGTSNASSGAKTVTLTFTTEAEIAVFNKLSKEAEDDDRTLSRFLVRKLKSLSESNA
jgi:hypothetical protein